MLGRIQIVAVETRHFIGTAVAGAAWRVANGKDKGDDDDTEKSEEYPASVADEVVLNPGNHDTTEKIRNAAG